MCTNRIHACLIVFWFIILLPGCARFSNITPPEAASWTGSESIIVMGIPDTHRIKINRGKSDGSRWKSDGVSEVLLDYGWKDGYLVRKVKSLPAHKGLGVLRITTRDKFFFEFRPCKGKQTLVFKVPPNKILYVGHLVLDPTSESKGSYRKDLDAARDYLQQNYPEIATNLVMADTEIRELSNVSCNFLLIDFLSAIPLAFPLH